MVHNPTELRFQIRIEAPTGNFLSESTYSDREEARKEIRRMRKQGGWENCRFYTVPTRP